MYTLPPAMLIPFSLTPDEITTLYNEADQARRAGNVDLAKRLLDRILARDPQHVRALYSYGVLAFESTQLESAQSWIERAIEAQPDPTSYNLLCFIQIRLGATANAIQTAQRGLALQPDLPSLNYFLALALQIQGHYEDAAHSYRRVLELEPDHQLVHKRLGDVVKNLGALGDAERHLRRAITLDPTSLGVRVSLGTVLLAAGKYEEAWPLFEDRWVNMVDEQGRSTPEPPDVPLPQWRGENPGATRRAEGMPVRAPRLLVFHEQGFGDSLQFVRYLPLALNHFSQVGYICPRPLKRLYEQSFGQRWPGVVVLDNVEPNFEEWDWYCPLMSLPMAFGTRLENVPAFTYLYADPGRAAWWHARLAALPNPGLPRVGVVWAGGHSNSSEDKVRSIRSAQFAPLLAMPHIRWISLQKTDDPAKLPEPAMEACLTSWMDDIDDFAETAALIANLDLVISVDTSVAHLAAAMGKPVWLLNRFAGCWRWLRDREDSPWYSSVRLFNQPQQGGWDVVLEQVAAALQQTFRPHGARDDPRSLP
ncbi:tetratricopeptide repeat protein [Paraburkholderia haematera]|uniref:Beta-barrel assembly-enhancing protease n=1 Tax=Paraburkholderia haematera TaxID=2793077 RepID=A0ABN7LZ59_9BURK|nr:tetratricopeptide repeat protein [Paraburkholderia haematera]CAE6769695.1 Beta-barrel assembly-enhancing protease [Paraburkholderia haematera]